MERQSELNAISNRSSAKFSLSQPASTKNIFQIIQDNSSEIILKINLREGQVNNVKDSIKIAISEGNDSNSNKNQTDIPKWDEYTERNKQATNFQNSDKVIAESITKLAQIAELDNENDAPSPSPKITVNPTDTWGRKDSKLDKTSKDLLEDFSQLELKYRLRSNWLENGEEYESPFSINISAIHTKSSLK